MLLHVRLEGLEERSEAIPTAELAKLVRRYVIGRSSRRLRPSYVVENALVPPFVKQEQLKPRNRLVIVRVVQGSVA